MRTFRSPASICEMVGRCTDSRCATWPCESPACSRAHRSRLPMSFLLSALSAMAALLRGQEAFRPLHKLLELHTSSAGFVDEGIEVVRDFHAEHIRQVNREIYPLITRSAGGSDQIGVAV